MPLRKYIIIRLLVIKFRPKGKVSNGQIDEMIGMQGNWVVSSLSYNLQKFIGSSFKYC